MKGIDFFQATEPDLLFRDVSLYTQPISSVAQAPGVIHQAIAAAYAGPGVAHLTLPQDVLSAKAEGSASSVATLKPRAEISPDENDVAEIARRIDQAGSIAIMCGAGCRGAGELLRALSDRLKAPLVHSVRGKEIMAYDDPHWMGGLGMIGTKAVYNAVQHCDLLLMVGTDYPYSNFARQGQGDPDRRAGHGVGPAHAGTLIGVTGSTRPTLKRLLDKVAPKTDAKFFDKVTTNGRGGTRC